MSEKKGSTEQGTVEQGIEDKVCGLVMPISSIDGCSEQHWLDVKEIITEAVEEAGFKANLVSHADDVGSIHKRIIQNLYDNPIIVCDVSGKNPNVMFELGMRLAFDKPTIIIKDDKTSYSFDTSSIEHLEYPRDLRFTRIVEFKKALAEKIKATLKKSLDDPNYTTFLKHFGTFTVAKLETKEVSKEDFIIEELKELKKIVTNRDPKKTTDVIKNKEPQPSPFDSLARIIANDIVLAVRDRYPSLSKEELKSEEYKKIIFSDLMNEKNPLSGYKKIDIETLNNAWEIAFS